MGGYASSKGNITLRRTFSSTQMEIHDDRVQYLVDPWTQQVFSNNNISQKKGVVKEHALNSLVKEGELYKEIMGIFDQLWKN